MDPSYALLFAAAAIPLGIVWEQRHKAHAAKLAKCAAQGHDMGTTFNAMDNPHWPVQACQCCGHQEHLTRCPCGRTVNRSTHEIVDDD